MHTRLHAYAHSHAHAHAHAHLHAHARASFGYLTQCQSKPKCEEVAGSWTQQSLCRAPHLSATRFQTHQALACLLVCLLFFFFCAMVGVTCQNRKLLRWTPHCAHPIVSFSSSSFHKLKFAVVSCIFSCPAVLESRMRHSAQ